MRVRGLGARLSAVPGRVEWEFPAGGFRYCPASVSTCVAVALPGHRDGGDWRVAIVALGRGTSPHQCPRCFSHDYLGSHAAPRATVHTMTLSAVSAACVLS